ncbi:MAG: MoaD family protein [Actinomycetota bacterium]
MGVRVEIPSVLRAHVAGAASLEAPSGGLRQVLDELSSRYPALRDQLMQNGELHRFVNVYVNDEDVRYLNGLETEVREGDVVSILPAVAGGAAPGAGRP